MKKIFFCSIVILLLLILGRSGIEKVALGQQESGSMWERLQFTAAGAGARRYSCYYNATDGIWYLLLPAGIAKEGLSVQKIPCEYITVDGKRYQAGADLTHLWDKEESSIAFYDRAGIQLEAGRIKVMKSENIPSFHINTASGEMQYLYENKDNKEAANLQVLTEKGDLTVVARLDYIKGRGNTTWEAPKKSFEIRLDQPLGLLGMEKAKTWILISNYYDGTYLRNRIGMEMENATDSRFADLYLNGHYEGLYQVTEKIGTSLSSGISGGYLLEFDYSERITDQAYILLENKQPVIVRGEKPVNEEELKQIEAFMAEMTAALNADDYINPKTQKHIFEYIDKDSFAKRYILEEFLQNMDAGFSSHYMYLSGSGDGMLLSAGPLWDLDNTMGRGIVREPSQLFADRYELAVNNLSRWHARLYANEDFFREVLKQYQIFAKPFLEWLLTVGIEAWEGELAAAVLMDEIRYGTRRSVFMTNSTKAAHMDFLTDYIAGKTAFLDYRWQDTPEAWQLWQRERLTGLPSIQVQTRPVAENSNNNAGNDGSMADGSWRGKIISWMVTSKGYLLFGCFMLSFMLMLGKEGYTGIVLSAQKKAGGQE